LNQILHHPTGSRLETQAMFASPRPGNKAHSLHEPSHMVLARENTSLTEFQRDPRASITAFEFMVYLANGVHKPPTIDLSPALATFDFPIVVANGHLYTEFDLVLTPCKEDCGKSKYKR
jgi:hypothetical protein